MGWGWGWGAHRDSGLNLLPAMLFWRRETGGTWIWFLCRSLRSGIGWGKGRKIEGIEKVERQRDRDTETNRKRDTELEGDRGHRKKGKTERGGEMDRESQRQKQKETKRIRDRWTEGKDNARK